MIIILEENEWKIRYETQCEINTQLRNQLKSLKEKHEEEKMKMKSGKKLIYLKIS